MRCVTLFIVGIRFLGAAKEVGRSAILLEHENGRILLDAGVKLGRTTEFPEIDEEMVRKIDFVVLTHAHLDHSGFLPFLVEMGFKGQVIATKPTRDLSQVLWADYRRIGKERGDRTFDAKVMNEALKRFEFLEYGERRKMGNNLYITLHDAGHILGSAQVLVEAGKKRILYSGDINPRPSRLHRGAVLGLGADVMIVESTYGSKKDRLPSYRTAGRELAERINETIEAGGRVLIPVFAVGRAQEVLLTIEAYMRTGVIPEVPLFIDGMIAKANRIYRANVLHLREEIWKGILLADIDPFRSPFYRVPRTKDRKDVLKEKPAIIVTTSGMLTGGPAIRYLKHIAREPESTVILVGYQAEGTLGRELQDGAETITIDGEEIPVKCAVYTAKFSAHGDYNDLMNYVRSSDPEQVFVVHGDPDKAMEFAGELEKKGYGAIVPERGDRYDLRAAARP